MSRQAAYLGVLVLAGGVAQAGDLVLVAEGRPSATIVVREGAPEKVTVAAEELRTYVERISGAQLPLVTDTERPDGALVLVGRSKLTDEMNVAVPNALTDGRRDEGYTIVCRDSRLVLAGNESGPYHGTEYAVYEFLHRLGVRWYMPGPNGEVVPHSERIRFPEIEFTDTPDFAMRNWWLHIKPELAEHERRWKLRNKMNPDPLFATPGDSSARNIVRPELLETRPELFARNADGTPSPYLPNLTNPEAVAVAADIIKEHFRQHPEANSYGFAPDDGLPRDYSPETLKVNRGFVDLLGRPGVPGEVSTTEEWLAFVNAVTREVRKEFPDKYIATNGYANRNIPPQGIGLDDHLIIMFAAIWSCTLHAYDDPHCWQKERQAQMLKRWAELCPNVWVYGYNYQMLVSGLTPLPEFTKLRRDFPLMHQWGLLGFLDENRNVWAEAGIASRYLRARLEWDAEADVDAILDGFFRDWYGPAAAHMKAYYLALDEAIAESPMHAHEDRALPDVYSGPLLEELSDHVRRAEDLAGAEPFRSRLQADLLMFDHLVAYRAMNAAERSADFAEAARHAQDMLDLRKRLFAIDPFYIWEDEDGYHTGVWYWKIADRRDWYQSLAERMTGPAGELVATLPERAAFRIDPHDEGLHAGWYTTADAPGDWQELSVTEPFFTQGYLDDRGFPYVGYAWYRFRVDLPADVSGKPVRLLIPTLTTEGWLWVNGQYVAHRPYLEAYTRPASLEADISAAIRPGARNVIAVRVSTSLCESQAAEGILGRPFVYIPPGPTEQ